MKGLLLLNTGTPQSFQAKDVRAFIETMLSDPKVLTLPNWARFLLVKGIIGPFRQYRVSKRYKMIWGDCKQSPLLHHANLLAEKLRDKANIQVEVGMRYLEPSLEKAMSSFAANKDLEELIIFPLFPHYADSSYQTAVDEALVCFKKKVDVSVACTVVDPYFNHPMYIKAIADSIRPYLKDDVDRLLFNYHSLPLSHVEVAHHKGLEYDYVFQTKETVRLVEDELGINSSKVRLGFSSALGSNWLEPSLDEIIKEMMSCDVKKIVVSSPGFALDNLETLYDIDVDARKLFESSGGKEFVYVPCLNSSDGWVDAMLEIAGLN